MRRPAAPDRDRHDRDVRHHRAGALPRAPPAGPALAGAPQLASSDPNRWLDEEKAVQRELNGLRKDHGLGLVVDLTCSGMGRNAAALARISAGARVAVVAGTGVFTEPFHPAYVREVLAAGAAPAPPDSRRTATRPGTRARRRSTGSRSACSPRSASAWTERTRCPASSARSAPGGGADRDRGAVPARRGPGGPLLRPVGRDLRARGPRPAGDPHLRRAAPGRVAVGQQDRVDDPAQHRKIAESGGYVSFGTLGLAGEDASAVGARVRRVLDLLEAGHADRVLLSTGVARMAQVGRYGGAGFGYLFDTFLPALRAAGADEATLGAILHDNPLRWLTGS
ncbi:aryldialkylphosphatase [Actinomadura luteofluorescens]|uniref:phosphotriesterase family protein n=1 Tax=Actinomadura luteofluorescens TaxID=46163 RepID=UPI00363F7F83